VTNGYDPTLSFDERAVESGLHRRIIGGNWDEIGRLQLNFLIDQGLATTDVLLDIACGSLRAGVHLAKYLDPGHYFGTDIVADLLRVGYEVELAEVDAQSRVPRENLQQVDRLEVPFATTSFDVAIAQSLWTHLPLNHIKLCLANLRPRMRPTGVLYATIFTFPDAMALHEAPPAWPGLSYESDPFAYPLADIEYAASSTGWTVELLGDWGHPFGQEMCRLRPTESE